MLNILFEDNDIIVVVKPVGTASQTERSMAPDMVSLLMNHQAKNGVKNPYVGVIHRLDKPVSGVMVYAKNKKAAASLSKSMTDGNWNKKYKAVICTKEPLEISDTPITLTDFLVRDGKTNTSKVCTKGTPDSKEAILKYTVIDTMKLSELPALQKYVICDSPDLTYTSLVDIELLTGRHHQIRVQFSSRNMTLFGDMKYGSSYFKKATVALFSYELSFKHPTTGKFMTFGAEPDGISFITRKCF